MEDIRRTALARYEASSDEVKQLVFDFFKKCDHDEDGKVKFRDLLKFFEQGGYGGVKPSFFEELGKGQDDLLDFEETIVVYYVVKTTNIKQDDSKIADSTSSETPKTAEHAQLKDIEQKFSNQNITKAPFRTQFPRPFRTQFPGPVGFLDVNGNNNSTVCNIL